MDSPTMEEGVEKEPTDMKNVSRLLKQLKVARGDEGKPGNGISDQNGHLFYSASQKETYRTSMERQVLKGELKKSSRDNSVEADGQVDELRDGNSMKCQAGERIEVSGREFEGQLESRVVGGDIPSVLTSKCLSDFKNGEHETLSTSLDEGMILPTSLPTSASVSRWIEGEQLHKVVIDHAIRIFYHCHRLILKRLGCQPACQRKRSSPACAGQPLSLCNSRTIVYLLT